MGFEDTKRNWERLAQADPLWAVCTDRRRHGRWDPAEFFSTGEREVDAVLGALAARGLEPADRDVALDFGGGVGRLTRALSRHFGRVVGLDVSATMIARAREYNADLGGERSGWSTGRPTWAASRTGISRWFTAASCCSTSRGRSRWATSGR